MRLDGREVGVGSGVDFGGVDAGGPAASTTPTVCVPSGAVRRRRPGRSRSGMCASRQGGRAGACAGGSVGARPTSRTVDLDSTVCEAVRQGQARRRVRPHHGYHPLVADQTPARCCTLGCGRDRLSAATCTQTLAGVAPAAVTVRADAGFFSYDMIAAIGAHGASYSITIPQNAKVAAIGPRRRRLGKHRIHPRRRGPGRDHHHLRGDDGAPAKLRRAPHPPELGARPSCGPTGDHARASASVRWPTPPWICHSETSKTAPGSAAEPLRRFPAPTSPAACSRTTSAGGLAGELTVAATIAHRHSPRLVNHSGRRKPACRGHANMPCGPSAACHWRQRPAQRSRTPRATNRTRSCTPQRRPAHAPAQRPPSPKPSVGGFRLSPRSPR